jgi:hypothetical protein
MVNQDLILRIQSDPIIWDKTYGLPLIWPFHAQAHFYNALVWRLVKSNNSEIPDTWIKADRAFSDACYEPAPGSLFYQMWSYPGRGGNNYSHDEMIGKAYTSWQDASDFLEDLDIHEWFYPDEHGNIPIDRLFSRFFFLEPYLRVRAGRHLGPIAQGKWAAYVLESAITTDLQNLNPSGLIKIWLMGEEMQKHPNTGEAYKIWLDAMKKAGIGPKLILTTRYLNEVPLLGEIAPENF